MYTIEANCETGKQHLRALTKAELRQAEIDAQNSPPSIEMPPDPVETLRARIAELETKLNALLTPSA
jgi:hypothetical protein